MVRKKMHWLGGKRLSQTNEQLVVAIALEIPCGCGGNADDYAWVLSVFEAGDFVAGGDAM